MKIKLTAALLKHFQRAGQRGGQQRAKNLTPERRTEISRQGANARWAKYRIGPLPETVRE